MRTVCPHCHKEIAFSVSGLCGNKMIQALTPQQFEKKRREEEQGEAAIKKASAELVTFVHRSTPWPLRDNAWTSAIIIMLILIFCVCSGVLLLPSYEKGMTKDDAVWIHVFFFGILPTILFLTIGARVRKKKRKLFFKLNPGYEKYSEEV